MRVTFANQLAFAEQGRGDTIRYKHPFRVNVDIYICKNGMAERNWDIRYVTHSASKVPDYIRDALAREFRNYIRLRVKRSAASLKYGDFVEMANAISIG